MSDLRFAFRQLAKSPGFTLVAVLTLALGIGVNTNIFGMFHVFFMQDRPVADADRIVHVLQQSETWPMPHSVSFPDFKDYREGATNTLEAMFAYLPNAAHLSAPGQSPERAWVEIVTPNAFTALGIRPALGRVLIPGDGEAPGHAPIVVLSHACWTNRFGGDPDIVGRVVQLNGKTFTVVGVTDETFTAFSAFMAVAGFVPTGAIDTLRPDGAGMLEWRNAPMWRVLAKLKPGQSAGAAQAEIAAVTSRIVEAHPASHSDINSTVITDKNARPDPSMSKVVPVITLFFIAMVLLVLLIACANVANLMFSHAATRQKEFSMRAALGASRGRLIRQILLESLLLACIAAPVGWMIGEFTADLLDRFQPSGDGDIPIAPVELGIGPMIVFTMLISLLAGLAAGLPPALRASRIDLNESLKQGAAAATAGERFRLRDFFVVSQVTLSLILLVSAGFFLRSLQQMRSVDLGFAPDNLYMVSFDLSLQGYDHDRTRTFNTELLERVRGLPGVQDASLTSFSPFSYMVEGRDVWPENPPPQMTSGNTSVSLAVVEPGLIRMLGVRMREGRPLAESDAADSPRVAVINQAFADRCWPGQEPVGKRFQPWQDGPWIEVVGTTDTGKFVMLYEPDRPFFFLPAAQQDPTAMTLLVRTPDGSDPALQATAVRSVFQTLDEDLPIYSETTMADQMTESVFAFMPFQMGATLAGTQGVIGLLLAVMGLYAVVAFNVVQRTREIGIRVALGAEPAHVVRKMVLGGLRLTGVGVAIGLVFAAMLGFVLSHIIYGLAPFDLVVVGGVTALLVGTAWFACYVPARRAAHIDPIEALRAE